MGLEDGIDEIENLKFDVARLRAVLEVVRVHVKKHERDLALAKIETALINKRERK